MALWWEGECGVFGECDRSEIRARRMVQSILRVVVKELYRLGVNFEKIVERGGAVRSESNRGKEGL